MGGGVFLVPLLVFLLGLPIQLAAGASIIAVVATSSAAAATYVRNELTNMRLGMFLELATTLGAVTGVFLMALTSESVLRIVFGVSLLYAASTMYLQMRRTKRRWVRRSNDGLAERLHLDGSYYDTAREELITYGVIRTRATFCISYLAGIVSGLLGIGGGGVKVPAMNVVSSVPMKAAVATSNFMIGVTAAASALVYIRHGYCDVFYTTPVTLGTILGATVGTMLTNRVKGVSLKLLFIAVLTIMAAMLIVTGVTAWYG